MSKKLPDQEQIIETMRLLGFFPYYYTQVTHHSRFAPITVNELQILEGKSRVIAEFLAVNGMTGVDFTPLRQVIEFVDGYLLTGSFKSDENQSLQDYCREQTKKFVPILKDYMDGGQANEDGTGAPVFLFAFSYGIEILKLCDMIEKNAEGDNKSKLLKICYERRRQDPDGDKPKQPVLA